MGRVMSEEKNEFPESEENNLSENTEDKSPQKKLKEEEREIQSTLKNVVLIHRLSPFALTEGVWLKQKRWIRLKYLQRAIGVVDATLTSYDNLNKKGTLKIEGEVYTFSKIATGFPNYWFNNDLNLFKDQQVQFSFWPTLESEPQADQATRITNLKIPRARCKQTPQSGYVEIIAQLQQIWENRFVLALWTTSRQKLYVEVAGVYPEPEHQGKFVWVIGKWNAKERRVDFVETSLIEYAPREVLEREKERQARRGDGKKIKKKEKEKKQKKAPPPKLAESPTLEPDPVLEFGYSKSYSPLNLHTDLAVSEIEVTSIDYPEESRYRLDLKRYKKLREEFKTKGCPSPIIVALNPEKRYLILDGLRRALVAKELKQRTIPAYIIVPTKSKS
jgi:hypothetical protein